MVFILFIINLFLNSSFASSSSACYIGSENENYYVTSFDKARLANTSPLVREYNFRKERLEHYHNINENKFSTFADALDKNKDQNSPFAAHNLAKYMEGKIFSEEKNWITKEEIRCALMKVPFIDAPKALCESTTKNPTYSQETPCVTEDMIDYIHFVTNKAFKCFGSKMDDATKEVLLKKINLESAFGFFFADSKGRGISQFVSISAYEMSSTAENGHRYLVQHLNSNPSVCGAFSEIIRVNPNPSIYKMNTCSYVNIEDGIGRSLIQGLGLYFYYRDISAHSAQKLMAWLGLPTSQNIYYQEMLKALTLGMYNKGPGTVMDSVKMLFEPHEFYKYKSKQKLAYKKFLEKIKVTNFYMYVTEANSQFHKVYSSNGSCKLQIGKNQR